MPITNPPDPPTLFIRTVPGTDNSALLNVEGTTTTQPPPETDFSAVWTDYEIHNRYVETSSKYMMAASCPAGSLPSAIGGTASFVQLARHPALDQRMDRLPLAQRPTVPDPDVTSSDENWVLLHRSMTPVSVVLGNDGESPLYRLSGVYVYGHRNPGETMTDKMSFGRPPYLEEFEGVGIDRRVTSDMFEDNLINGFGFPQPYNAPGD